MGIVIFAIGVTSSVKGLELNAIANKPNDTYVYHVNDFDAIVNIAAALEYTTCDQPTELQNGTANGSLDRNEKQNFQYAYTSKGLTLSLNGSQGCTVAYISASTPNPNAASYDFILMAKEGQGTVTLHLTVDDLNKNCTSEFARERREAESPETTGSGSIIGTVFITIEGQQETNDFVLMVSEGDVTDLSTTEAPTTTEEVPTTMQAVPTKPDATNSCNFVAADTTYVSLCVLFWAQLAIRC